MAPQDVSLAKGAAVIDKVLTLANVTDGFTGAAPDLGALELGCPLPHFGPRAEGSDESTDNPICGMTPPGGDGGTSQDGAVLDGDDAGPPGAASGDASGCGCRMESNGVGMGGAAAWLAVCLAALRRTRRRRAPS